MLGTISWSLSYKRGIYRKRFYLHVVFISLTQIYYARAAYNLAAGDVTGRNVGVGLWGDR